MIYSPREDSFLLRKYVKEYSKGKKVLDMGSGSGIQAISAKESGASEVLACDINENAVKYIRKRGISAVKSNLFENIEGRFDLIVFNPPYLPENEYEDIESRITTTGGKEGDEIILKFIKDSAEYLNDDGKILIVISSLTPRKRLIETMRELGMEHKVLEKRKLFMEELEAWVIGFK